MKALPLLDIYKIWLSNECILLPQYRVVAASLTYIPGILSIAQPCSILAEIAWRDWIVLGMVGPAVCSAERCFPRVMNIMIFCLLVAG